MSALKKCWKIFWAHTWEFIKLSFNPALMYLVASTVTMIILTKMGEEIEMGKLVSWGVVLGFIATAYNGLLMYAVGGSQFEMLLSGNMKRQSSGTLRMSSHKIVKEYRPWKGFVAGVFSVWALIAGSIVFGVNVEHFSEEYFSKGLGVAILIFDLLAGWVLLPYQMYNKLGIAKNPFFGLLIALIPIAVSGGCYIWGAYAKRNKILRQQEIAARQAMESESKPKKINYGGLPGTKPKKRR
ncbi:MAG: hypothetical protein IIX01_01415 [Clostridia bacterium]|nr:hypothetical protein [Clostridia bacterium]